MLRNFENYLRLHVNSKITIKNYCFIISLFFKHETDFTQLSINNYLSNIITNKKSVSTFNVAICALKKYAQFKNIDIDFPKLRKVPHTIKTTITRDEIEKEILPYFSVMFNDPDKRKLIFRFMFLSMLRISEVISIEKKDVDLKSLKINVYNAKGNKNRVTFLHKILVSDVKKIMESHSKDTVFNISKGYVEYMFRTINQQLNYKKKLSAHSLRHAGALRFYEETKDLKALQMILGHESILTTETYVRDYDINKIQYMFNQINYRKGSKNEY